MNDLTWNVHVTAITKKASKRLYFLTQLKRAGVPKQDLAMFYVSCVRCYSLCSTCFLQRSPQVLKERAGSARGKSNINNNIRKVQLGNRGGVTPILDHHYGLCSKLFDNIVIDPNHKLKALLPPVYDN